MRHIFKYPFPFNTGNIDLDIPLDAKLLTIGVQGEQYKTFCVWAEVNPSNAMAKRRIVCLATGDEVVNSSFPYINTVFDGPFIWHFYDAGEVW